MGNAFYWVSALMPKFYWQNMGCNLCTKLFVMVDEMIMLFKTMVRHIQRCDLYSVSMVHTYYPGVYIYI